jgi:hypothetical protein
VVDDLFLGDDATSVFSEDFEQGKLKGGEFQLFSMEGGFVME